MAPNPKNQPLAEEFLNRRNLFSKEQWELIVERNIACSMMAERFVVGGDEDLGDYRDLNLAPCLPVVVAMPSVATVTAVRGSVREMCCHNWKSSWH